MTELSYMPQDEMNMRDYMRVLFRQKGVVFLSIVVVILVVFYGLALKTPVYEAQVKMLVSGQKQAEGPYYKELLTTGETQESLTQSEIVTSDPILQRAVVALHLYDRPMDYENEFASPLKRKLIALQLKKYQTRVGRMTPAEQEIYKYRNAVESLRKSIKVEPVRDTNLFLIKVKDYDPVGASVMANVVSRSYVIFDLEQQMAELQLKYGPKHPLVVQLQDNIKRMTDNLSGKPVSDEEAIGTASVKIIEQANVPIEPTGPKKLIIMLLGSVMSIFLGVMLAFIFEYMDQTIKSPQELERSLGIPYFGAIPRCGLPWKQFAKGMISRWTSRRFIRAFHTLSDQIHVLLVSNSFKTILIAAADKNDQASVIAAHLGYQLAEHTGKKVVIIDADSRKGTVHKIFGIPSKIGLMNVLAVEAQVGEVITQFNPRLSIIPAGQTKLNPMILLDSPKTVQLLDALKAEYDLILITCAELKSYKDGCLLASMVDKTLFVVSENETRRQTASSVMAALKEHKISFLGAILNKRTFPIPRFIYDRI